MKGKGLIQSRKHCLGLPEHLQASSPGVGGRAFTWERCTEGKLEDVCITPQSSYAYACDMTSFYPVFESRDDFKLKPSHPLNLSSAVDVD